MFYLNSEESQNAFVASQVDGTWHDAIEVPGFGEIEDASWISAISCPSAGNCSAAGIWNYENTERPSGSVFVINEVNGTWRRYRPVIQKGSSELSTRSCTGYKGMVPVSDE